MNVIEGDFEMGKGAEPYTIGSIFCWTDGSIMKIMSYM